MKTLICFISLFILSFSATANELPHRHSFDVSGYGKTVLDSKAAAEYSLKKRGWMIATETDTTYEAKLNKRDIRARIVINMKTPVVEILSYTQREDTEQIPFKPAQQRTVLRPYYPRGWISNIERDMKHYLANQPAIDAESVALSKNAESPEFRLKRLHSLLEKQLISEQEYRDKRQEILQAL